MTDEKSYISPNAENTPIDNAPNTPTDNTPNATNSADKSSINQAQLFSLNGRIGRLRFFAYAFGTSYLGMIVIAIILDGYGTSGGVIGNLFHLPFLALGLIFMVRRLNDLDQTGWLSLLFLIPVINILLVLYLLFATGSSEVNKYGAPPYENSMGVKIFAISVPILAVVGSIIIIFAVLGFLNEILEMLGF